MAIFKEILQVIVLILFVSLASFFILYLLPGSSDVVRAGLDYTGEIKTQYSLQEFISTYFSWLQHALQGDFGVSEYSQEKVMHIIAQRIVVSLVIASVSMILTIVSALVWCWSKEYVSYKYGEAGRIIRIVLKFYLVVSNWLEYFLLSFIPLTMAILVLSVFSILQIPILAGGWLTNLYIPIGVLVLIQFPHYIRSLQESLGQMSQSSFVDFSYSLGYSHRWVWWREILPNSLVFTLNLSVVQLSYLVGGSIIVEKIFLVPGLGSGLVDAVMSRDRPVVQAIIVIVAVMVGVIHACFEICKERVYGRN